MSDNLLVGARSLNTGSGHATIVAVRVCIVLFVCLVSMVTCGMAYSRTTGY